MTDRELLELAAKAAGVAGEWVDNYNGDYYYQGNTDGILYELPHGGWFVWNPLTDDGDALRLAATLGIDIEWRADGRVAAYRHANANGYCFTAFESSREDRAANVRRAIVHAAAEIGRNMK